MKHFLKKLSIFLALLLALDFAVGNIYVLLKNHAKGGSTYQNEYIANECTPDILILGSSRAAHHYDPSVISNILSLSCYNAGKDGCGIVLGYTRFSMIRERKKPYVVLYEITPIFDYIAEDTTDYSAEIGMVKPYYKKGSVQEVINRFSTKEDKFLMKVSLLYRYNSRLLPIVLDTLVSRDATLKNGFVPLSGTFENKNLKNESENEDLQIDFQKYALLEQFIQECNQEDITLFFIVSPMYDKQISTKYDPAIELAQKYNIPFWNYSTIEGISMNNDLFQDATHMNKDGARLFSEIIATELQEFIDTKTPGRENIEK